MIEPTIPPDLWFEFPPTHRPARPPAWRGGAGGHSGSDLWQLDAAAGPLVLRRWPPDGPDAARLDRIHGWLARLAPLPFIPVPFVGRAGRAWVAAGGRSWELAPWMPGAPDLGQPPSPAHLGTMFGTVARVHLLLAPETTLAPSPGLVARRDELRQLIDWEFVGLRSAVAAVPDTDARWCAERWLDLASLMAGEVAGRVAADAGRAIPLQPALRDARPDHFLFEGDRLTGLVDFGAMGVESVASDLARLLGQTVGRDRDARSAGLAAYRGVRSLSGEDLELIRTFEAANAVLGGARWVRWHFVAGRRFDDPGAVTAGLRRSYQRLVDWVETQRSP